MKKWLNAYFGLNRRELSGVLTLFALIVVIGLVPRFYSYLIPAHPDEVQVRQAIRELIASSENGKSNATFKTVRPVRNKKIKQSVLFYFDPNTIGIKEWQLLGLSERQAAAVLKYRSKGGRFRKPEDLRKMYTINNEVYDLILPYVRIAPADSEIRRSKEIYKNGEAYVKPTSKVVEVNGADSLELEELKGIGPVFARRIIKYRDRLGGFHKKDQLMEIFGLDSLKFKAVKDQIIIDDLKLKKININTAVFEDFKNHPYIRYKQANALIQYRKQHGNYSNIADLSKVAALDPETIARLAPYFTF